MKIKINGKVLSKFILYFSMICVGISLSGFIVLPNELFYLTDIALVLLVLFILKRLAAGFKYYNSYVKTIVIFIFIILVYNILTGLINLVNPLWLLRGIRGALRFYFLSLGMIIYWDEQDVSQFFSLMIKLYPLNFGIVIIQKLLWGNNPDSVIGITGTFLPVYLAFVFAYMLVAYMQKQEKFWRLVAVILINFIIAIWGDQRGYYFMFISIVISFVFLERVSIKKILLVIACLCAIMMGLYIMSIMAPESFKTLIDLNAVYEYGTSTSGGYNISRFGAFNEINELFFHDNIWRNLFGYGLGFCEVNSPFYNIFGYLHYTWFTHQWTFLEGGYVGLILLAGYFIILFWSAGKNLKTIGNTENKIYVKTVAMICIVGIITIFYFSMHRSNSGYFLYAITAMMPIILKSERSDNCVA